MHRLLKISRSPFPLIPFYSFSTSPFLTTLSKTGLSPTILNTISTDPKLLSTFELIFSKFDQNESNVLTKTQANLFYTLAKKMPPMNENTDNIIERFSTYIKTGKIQENNHLEKILQGLKGQIVREGGVDWNDFEKKTGLGAEYSHETICEKIKGILKKNRECVMKNNMCSLLRSIRNELPGASSQTIFSLFNKELKDLKEVTETINTTSNKTKLQDETTQHEMKKEEENLNKCVHIWDKLKDLNTARNLVLANNTQENFNKHWSFTQGRIFLRFPPEPNGFLHIGHAKAIRANFNSAVQLNGVCNLRYDDTNPEKESKEFIDHIEQNIRWLGYKPDKITHASDYFSEIYEYAVQLIKMEKAYICQQNQTDLQAFRKAKMESPYRNREVSENLRLFEEMKNGKHPEGSYCLRLKIDPQHPNPTMRDPVAYRIKNHPHPKTQKEWNMYPTYDFTHCISDSLENISHSLCTLEFEIRRDLYYWILNALGIFKPVVWEYSRLNISHTILSKRKLAILVKEGIVNGWDDPRLLSLEGLKRRGYTPESINEFCDLINVTRRGNENIISIHLLEYCLRKNLDGRADRTMGVLEPVKLVIEDLEEDYEKVLKVLVHPKNEKRGFREIKLKKNLFIERKDVKTKDKKDFYGLAIDKVVCLKYAGFVKCSKIETNPQTGEVTKVFAKTVENKDGKIKGVIHWLAEEEAVDCEVRMFEYLFKTEEPNSLEDFKQGVNENSKIVMKGCKVHKNFNGSQNSHFQFERIGYLVLDKDSKEKELVFNVAVGLKEKPKKGQCKET